MWIENEKSNHWTLDNWYIFSRQCESWRFVCKYFHHCSKVKWPHHILDIASFLPFLPDNFQWKTLRKNYFIHNLLQAKVSMMHNPLGDQIQYRPYMGINNITIDICKYMNGHTYSILFDMFLKNFKNYGNMYQPCPFAKVEKMFFSLS